MKESSDLKEATPWEKSVKLSILLAHRSQVTKLS